jgi:hypothetical protein
MNTLVVAKWKEDVGWLSQVSGWNMALFDKGAGQLPNYPGREAHTYLHWIVENYWNLPAEVAFCQGNPFDHCPSFLRDLQDNTRRIYGHLTESCDPDGMPRIRGLRLNDYALACGFEAKQKYTFVSGAQFRLNWNQITQRPITLYAGLLFMCKVEPLSGYILERLWNDLFSLNL